MNNDIKVNLNITLPGRVMLSEQGCSENPRKNYQIVNVEVSGLGDKRKKVPIGLRKCKPATQSLNLSMEAYKFMTGNETPSFFKNPFMWKKLSTKQRLEAHLTNLCEYLGGTGFTYVIL